MASINSINWETMENRSKLDAWIQLIKRGVGGKEAMIFIGIENLENAIFRSGLLTVESEISESTSANEKEKENSQIDQSENIDCSSKSIITEPDWNIDQSDHESMEITEEFSDALEEIDQSMPSEEKEIEKSIIVCSNSDQSMITVDDKTNRTEASGDQDFETKNKLDAIEESDDKNILEDLVDWLLSEAEYCSHTLLMASGNVLVDAKGNLVQNFLWGPSGHDSLIDADRHVSLFEVASRRLQSALESLQLLFDCSTIRSRLSYKERYQNIIAMILAPGNEIKIELENLRIDGDRDSSNKRVKVKPFYEVIADETRSQDLYLLKNGLNGYVDALQRLLERLSNVDWNLQILRSLNDAADLICDYEQVRCMVGNLGAAKKITDIRVKDSYLALFRKAFGSLKFTNKVRIMECFYKTNGAPLWQDVDDEMEKNLTLAINKLCVQNKNKEYIRKLSTEFSWFFMLSLKFTWWRLLQAILRMPAIIPIIVEVLRELTPVTAVRINVTGTPIILVGLRRLLDEKQVVNEEHESNWTRLVCALTSTKPWIPLSKKEKEDGVQPKAVIGKTEAISVFLSPIIATYPRLGIGTLLNLIDDETDKVEWSVGDDGINAAKMFATMVEIFTTSRQRQAPDDAAIAKLSFSTLRCLVGMWKEEGIQFSIDEIQMLEQKFETLPWTTRILIFGYLRDLSQNPVYLHLPQCVFDFFDLPANLYRFVDCEDWSDDHSKVFCALNGIFRVGGFSTEAARDILFVSKLEQMAARIKEDQLNELALDALAEALTECQSVDEWRNSVELLAVFFDRLKEVMGDSMDENTALKEFSVGLRAVMPVGKLCEAVIKMLKRKPTSSSDYVRNFSIIANEAIAEGVQSLTEPLAKFVACEYLFAVCCALTTALGGRSPTEMSTLLNSIINIVKRGSIKGNGEVFLAAASFLEDDKVTDKLNSCFF